MDIALVAQLVDESKAAPVFMHQEMAVEDKPRVEGVESKPNVLERVILLSQHIVPVPVGEVSGNGTPE